MCHSMRSSLKEQTGKSNKRAFNKYLADVLQTSCKLQPNRRWLTKRLPSILTVSKLLTVENTDSIEDSSPPKAIALFCFVLLKQTVLFRFLLTVCLPFGAPFFALSSAYSPVKHHFRLIIIPMMNRQQQLPHYFIAIKGRTHVPAPLVPGNAGFAVYQFATSAADETRCHFS